MTQATVVVIDDDDAIQDSLDFLITSVGYRHQGFTSAEAFLEYALPPPPCCAIVDMHMPGINGLELQATLNAQATPLPLVFMSGEVNTGRIEHALRAGAVDFLAKPCHPDRLLACVDDALKASINGTHPAYPAWFDAIAATNLTPRQQTILQLAAYESALPEVADILNIAPSHIESQYKQAMAELRTHTSARDVYAWLSRSRGGGDRIRTRQTSQNWPHAKGLFVQLHRIATRSVVATNRWSLRHHISANQPEHSPCQPQVVAHRRSVSRHNRLSVGRLHPAELRPVTPNCALANAPVW